MAELSPLEARIFNQGERLIPGRSHAYDEVRRHYASYLFFRDIIALDLGGRPSSSEPVTIVDFGCGVAHGSAMLADIPGTQVIGLDMSSESLEYARLHYARPNLTLKQCDLIEYTRDMPEVDYVVSRGVMEHVVDGLHVIEKTRWRRRLLFDVPYAEPSGGNPHHVVPDITEEHFRDFKDCEIIFEDLEGVIYHADQKPAKPNMIMCLCRGAGMAPVGHRIALPYVVDWSRYGEEAREVPKPVIAAPVVPVAPPPNRLKHWLKKVFSPGPRAGEN